MGELLRTQQEHFVSVLTCRRR